MRRWLMLFVLALCPLGSAQTYVQLILDASGSTWHRLPDGEYRITAAKNALGGDLQAVAAALRAAGIKIDLKIIGFANGAPVT